MSLGVGVLTVAVLLCAAMVPAGQAGAVTQAGASVQAGASMQAGRSYQDVHASAHRICHSWKGNDQMAARMS